MGKYFVYFSLVASVVMSGCYNSSEPPLSKSAKLILASVDDVNLDKNSNGDIIGPTNLIWKEQVSGLKTYVESVAYCKALGSGWRVPNRGELLNLIAFSNGNGADAHLLKSGFSVTESSSWAKDRYFVNFKSGADDFETDSTKERPVLCVYGKSVVSSIFEQDSTDSNIVIDKSLGLKWYKSTKKFSIKDDNASNYCSSLGSDWELPNINELRSLVDYENEELYSTIFSHSAGKIWSKTRFSNGDGSSNYYLDIDQNITIDSEQRVEKLGVTCVQR